MKELNGSKTISEDEVDYLFCKFDVSENCGIERNEMEKMLYDCKATLRACLKLCLYLTSTTSIVLGASSGANSENCFLI